MPGDPTWLPPDGTAVARSAAALIGAEGLHFHDLRHTGNTFAAVGGTAGALVPVGSESGAAKV